MRRYIKPSTWVLSAMALVVIVLSLLKGEWQVALPWALVILLNLLLDVTRGLNDEMRKRGTEDYFVTLPSPSSHLTVAAGVARFVLVHEDGTRLPLDTHGRVTPDRPGRWRVETEEVSS